MAKISPADLITNPDGSVYHLNLLPHEIADTIILVGDPARVNMVSSQFDSVRIIKEKREFITHTGIYKAMAISVISTGIGIGSMDIVMNELDALASIDLWTGEIKQEPKKLKIIRIGTSGSIQRDIIPGDCLVLAKTMGMDNLSDYYKPVYTKEEQAMLHSIATQLPEGLHFYLGSASLRLLESFESFCKKGMAAVAPGFYGPQQ
ncbi:MAG: phosphorylase, partial [Bacteroidota bacterium]|nr:phosphorylase [Bacteroidota bacterium]